MFAEIPKNKIMLQVNLSPVRWRDRVIARLSYSQMLDQLEGKGANQVNLISVTPKESRYNEELQVGI